MTADIEAVIAEVARAREEKWRRKRERKAIDTAQHRKARTYGVPVRQARRAHQIRRTR